jgi:hypothetical protein
MGHKCTCKSNAEHGSGECSRGAEKAGGECYVCEWNQCMDTSPSTKMSGALPADSSRSEYSSSRPGHDEDDNVKDKQNEAQSKPN